MFISSIKENNRIDMNFLTVMGFRLEGGVAVGP